MPTERAATGRTPSSRSVDTLTKARLDCSPGEDASTIIGSVGAADVLGTAFSGEARNRDGLPLADS